MNLLILLVAVFIICGSVSIAIGSPEPIGWCVTFSIVVCVGYAIYKVLLKILS